MSEEQYEVIKKLVLTVVNVAIIVFVFLVSFFIAKHLLDIIVYGLLFSPLILAIVIFAKGY